jgi:hypothetical protein
MPDRLEFTRTREKQLGHLIISLVVVAACWFESSTTQDIVHHMAASFGVAFFALCAMIAAKRMTSGGVRFVDRAGVSFPGELRAAPLERGQELLRRGIFLGPGLRSSFVHQRFHKS